MQRERFVWHILCNAGSGWTSFWYGRQKQRWQVSFTRLPYMQWLHYIIFHCIPIYIPMIFALCSHAIPIIPLHTGKHVHFLQEPILANTSHIPNPYRWWCKNICRNMIWLALNHTDLQFKLNEKQVVPRPWCQRRLGSSEFSNSMIVWYCSILVLPHAFEAELGLICRCYPSCFREAQCSSHSKRWHEMS